ncbi:S-layer homology domain-containing protein [Alkalihalophilus pseudofirmus]|uniref:5'-nucleotidase C-terminal domain-containing protein n=1 Tax=Alkalihalophilus pseudofirmus TaxID=79885 RepID=UPI00259B4304|nr:S-layer homology domain-containing protein [Alkalihalophilus pseudofirmus]WEG16625.1 S-layer homology domain-containing protein [Alkalihalophilus pseudofirmus]
MMNGKWLKSMLATLLILASCFSFSGLALADDSDSVTLDIVHTNDMHAKIANFGKISAYIDEKRAESSNFLYLDAGDIFSGNPVVDLQDGEPIIALLNEMGLDAMAIGNHEFDYGQEAFQERVEQSNFPWLSANTEVVDETIAIEQPEPYEIFELEDVTVGVLGLTQTPPATAPAGIVGLDFHDPVATALQYEYVADEVDVFVALTHIGYNEDQRLAKEVDFFDVIIGGHSHTTLEEPVVVNGTSIAQTGGDANNIGNLEITYNKQTDEVTVTGGLQKVSELEAVNAEVDAMVKAYEAEAEELLGEVIGHTTTGLTRDGRYQGDAPLGNFWMDSILHSVPSADISLTNGGGIRASIEPGDITAGDIYTVEPFGNIITIKEMTGAALKDVIEYSYSWRDTNQIDLQTAGLNYTIYVDEDNEFVDAELFVDGEPIDPAATYTVALNNFIATGGDGYNFEGEMIQEDAGYVTNAMIAYARHLMETEGVIDYEVEGRIQVKSADELPGTPEEPAPSFSDVPESHWAFDYIESLTAKEVIFGYPDGTFKPSSNITRAHFTALLVRALDLDAGEAAENPFTDVTEAQSADVLAAYEAGIVSGITETTFAPNALITREQMVTMLMRAYEYETDTTIDVEADLSFEDASSISPYAQAYVQYATDLGIISGTADGKLFEPKGAATRAQAATVLYFYGELNE